MSKEQTPKLCVHCHCPIGKCEWGCIKYGKMKEQTTIEVRALEFCEKHSHKLNAVDSCNLKSMLVDFANSEVLEALEREIPKVFVLGESQKDKYLNAKEYYETEVKPKYKK